MQFDTHKNFAIGHIATAPTPATTGETFILLPGDGQFFDANMPCTIWPSTAVMPTFDNAEIGYVTAISGDELTITRAQEGSIAKPIADGWVVMGSVTAKSLQDIEDAMSSAGDKTFRQDFTTTNTLSVAHNLNKRPAVTVVDSAGDEVEVEVTYLDNDNLTINLAGGFSGSVYCN